MCICTTAGRGSEGLESQLYDYARRVASGEIVNAEFLPVLFQAEAGDDWQDEATWFKGQPRLERRLSVAVGSAGARESGKRAFLRGPQTVAFHTRVGFPARN